MTSYALSVAVFCILFLGFMRLPEWAQVAVSFVLLAIIIAVLMLLGSAFFTGINVIEVLLNLSRL